MSLQNIKILLLLFVMLSSIVCKSQDTIVKRDGTQINARILEVGIKSVTYKKLNNPNGPTYTDKRRQIYKIIYSNGSYDILNSRKKDLSLEYEQYVASDEQIRLLRYYQSIPKTISINDTFSVDNDRSPELNYIVIDSLRFTIVAFEKKHYLIIDLTHYENVNYFYKDDKYLSFLKNTYFSIYGSC